MESINIKIAEAKKVYERFWESYQKGDLETFSSTLDDDFEMIGTSESEIAHSKEDGIRFFKSQMDEVLGIAEMRNRQINVLPRDRYVLINEACDIYVLTGSEWSFYSKIRISTWLKETENGWKVAQQHGSLPDMRVREGETMALDKISKENLELRDAIKRRTIELENKSKELEIEASLERVRAVAMGMKTPDDMLQICRIISREITKFGINGIRNIQTVIIQEQKEIYLCYQYFPAYEQDIIEHTEYLKDPTELALVNRMLEAKDGYFEGSLEGMELEGFITHRKEENYLLDPLLDEVNELFYFFYSIGPGALGITLYHELPPEGLTIFKRFHQVFALAYSRFRDIEKAEAQAREAQIEAALERVRSKSIGMHKSTDLIDIAQVLFQEVEQIGVSSWAAGFNIMDNDKPISKSWMSLLGHITPPLDMPHDEDPTFQRIYKAWKNQEKGFVEGVGGEDLVTHYDYMMGVFTSVADSTIQSTIPPFEPPTFQVFNAAFFKYGYLMFITFDIQETSQSIFHRFAKVFEQTYTRFLDLQKAEAQAREAEIELALERVRARTMAMHSSSELTEASTLLDQQVRSLGIQTWGCAFHVYAEDEAGDYEWFSSANGSLPFYKTPREQFFLDFYERGQCGEKFYVKEFAEGECNAHYDYLKTIPVMGDSLKALEKSGITLPTYQIDHIAFFKHGYILFITYEPVLESHAIFQRFAKVFEQTYTRFLDLQKAEIQNREAEIQLALERVRARTMAMQKSDELRETIGVIFEQLVKLKFDVRQCSVTLIDHEKREIESFQSAEVLSVLPHSFKIPFMEGPLYDKLVQWGLFDKSGYTVNTIEGEDKVAFDDFMFENTPLKFAPQEVIDFMRSVKKLITCGAHMSYGLIEVVTNDEPISAEQAEILQRFSQVFEQTYTRFLDLQKAEAQAREARIESALERIRGQVASMRESTELLEIVVTMRSEFVALGHEAHYFWHMRWLPDSYEKAMTSGDGTQIGMVMSLPRRIHGDIKLVADWEKSSDPILVLAMETETAVDYVHKMITWGDFERIDPQAPTLDDIRHIQGLTFVMARTSHGEIGFSLPGSVPNPPQEAMDTLVRFAKVFGLAYKRFEDLKIAEHQTRETQNELALERVRSRSMAMQRSEELQEVIQVVYQQFVGLGIPIEHTGFIMDYKDREDMNIWLADSNQFHSEITFPYFDSPHWNSFVEAKAKGENFFANLLDFETKNRFYQDLFSLIPDLPKETQDFYFAQEGLSISTVLLDNVGLYIENYTTTPFTEEENRVLIRFGKVFQQTYTRFLDLQKAEAQAREAVIEASLERVRAQTMAMHNSEDVGKCIVMMFAELTVLGVNEETRFGIGILNHENENNQLWTATKNGEEFKLHIGNLEMSWHPLLKSARKAWKAQDSLHRYILEGEDLVNYYQMLNQAPDYKIQIDIEKLPEREFHYGFVFEHGFFYAFCPDEFSQDNIDLIHRFSSQFAQTYRRYLDLKKAEAQAKEAKIEAALEKVRSRTMGMQHSDELPEAANVLFTEVRKLGIPAWSCGYNILSKDLKSSMCWMSSENEIQEPFRLPLTEHESMLPWHEAITTNQSFFVYEQGGEDLVEHYRYLGNLPELKSVFAQFEAANISLPTFQVNHLARFEQGFLLFITYERVPEEHTIFQRFTKVFEQTYTRFLDLQKAEAQAKESKIEAALERIRSRSLAMHHSSELSAVVDTLLQEFTKLEFTLTFCIINLIDEQDMSNTVWAANPETGKDPESYYMKFEDYPFHHAMWDAWKSQKKRFIYTIEGEEKKIYDEYLYSETEFRRFPKHVQDANKALERYVAGFTFFKFSGLQTVSEDYISEDDLNILERFGRVFEQAYTRFLDLQKAEAQAREAQIELSLERIRAQVTAMRQSDELFDIVVLMRKEFISLGHEADYFWHMKWTPENYDMSMTSEDGERVGMIISVPKFVHDEIPLLAEWEKSDSPLFALDLNGQEAWDYIDKMNTYGKYEQADPHAPSKEDIMAIGGLTFVIARTTHGEIGFSLPGQVPNPPEESLGTLVRFASVFDLAYRRFEDLLTSEKQTRKAKIELALERVRARAMAMQDPEELIEVAQVMREEMGLLGVEELETSSIYINKNDAGKAECWYSIKDIRDGAKTYMADHFDLNYQDTWVGRQMLNFYQSEETKTSILMKGEDRVEWINYCANQSPKLEGYYGTEIPERTYHLTKFSNGAIGAATPGEISSESWDLLRRAALVFSLAYSRFKDLSQAREDLKKLKKAKAKAEKALNELKSAQEQLIQQEKLASLGQLTAGIAHEIKNPLNFVNNFSELSAELIEEVFEELENLEDSDTKEEIIAILNDVKSNLSKVHEHGTRANGIVSSMLQHSRASGSKREPKPFNPLVKEFVNLSFHGMRAGKAPINVDIDFQLDPEVGEVSLISEDFSRVILNLCNNAFDAMRDKFLKTGDGRRETEDGNSYLPKLTVKTSLQKDKVLLSIADNGGGIPEEIKDKILQPFFTTKKGTEGTGLGLSITNDIVKAHGGELKVESSQGKGSIFSIQIPIQ